MSDASMFMRVRRIIRSSPSRRYIVVSAPGKRAPTDEKITDLLYRAYEADSKGNHSILAQIFERYASIRDALAPDFDLEAEFAQLRSRLHQSPDYAASRGEYLCAKLFAAYAHMPFVDATELLLFNALGEIDFEATCQCVKEKLLPLKEAVIPGFYARMPDGTVRTFSRGGSDVSGALLAAALHAQLYENWTDVDGLYTADPTIVPNPTRNLEVSLAQMERIAEAGANLLHPDALRPLRGTGIDTVLKNTFVPGASGTRISEGVTECVRCVTGRRNLYLLAGAADAKEAGDALLHAFPISGSVKVATVNVFGLTDEKLRRVESIINPIDIIHMQEHIQIIVPEREYETTIRIIHEILTKDGDLA